MIGTLAARDVVKRYGGVVALAEGNLDVRGGEVVALIGANGSGKSTLSKIITGVVAPDGGQLRLDGEPLRLASPAAARRLGITAVYQELSLIPDMTVSQNIWLGHEPLRAGIRINNRQVRRRTRELLDLFADTFQSTPDPEAPVTDLTPDEKQIVEILKALSQEPRVIILDEATASLDRRQVERLFELIRQWKSEGMAVVFTSHRMDEIFRIADRAVVLRNGVTVGDVPLDSRTSERDLVNLMIEASAPTEIAERVPVPADAPVRLEARGLRTNILRGIDLHVRDGEILGIGGLQRQGQSDLLLAIFGAIPFTGEITYGGKPIHFTHPRQAVKAGVAFVPGDRATEGLLMSRSILDNLQLPSWGRYGLPLRMQSARDDAKEAMASLRVIAESLEAPASSLSGGNAQKIVLGKWLLRNPSLLLLNDPTKGVDVGAKGEFYNLLSTLQKAGTAILLYSSEDEELLALCARVLVLHDGAVRAELSGSSLNHTELVAASMGTVQEGITASIDKVQEEIA
jgi:ribose transport system ATP-binding protein